MLVAQSNSMADSDHEDNRLAHVSDEEVLHDEEAVEELLASRKRGLGALFKSKARDPNQAVSHEPPAPHDSRRERRRERRTRRRRRGKTNDDESGLLYEREGLVSSGSDADSTSSLDVISEKVPPPRKNRRRFRFVFVFAALIALMLALLYGTYRTSEHDALRQQPQLRSNGSSLFAPTTILISLDGFRADFLHRDLTPTLNQFISQGISPKYMLPSFPSLTFPNHWTLVTGQYPEAHGVVGNSFWDPQLEEEFWYTDPAKSMDPKWWVSTGAEPLWSTAETQGVRAAVHMWPGSEAGVEPAPTYVDKYNGEELLGVKVRRILKYIDRPSELDDESVANDAARPRFIGFYVPNVDAAGHKYGPNSTEIQKSILEVDEMLQELFNGLEARNLTDIVNIVVVSDHGMATTSIERMYQLEDYVNPDDIAHIDGWPLYGLRPHPHVDVGALASELKKRTAHDRNLDVYLREEMPERWHFSHSDRIAPLWLVPAAGWAIVQRKDFDIVAAQAAGEDYTLKGLHGYDHEHPLMRAIFAARGPAFPHAPHSEVPVFQNIEVYNIVCDTLGLTPQPNNGTLRLPLKPVGIHGQAPEDTVPTPSEGKESDTGKGEDEEVGDGNEEEPQQLTWFGSLIDKVKSTLHNLASIFQSAEEAKEEADQNAAA